MTKKSNKILVSLYKKLLLIRRVEENIAEKYKEREMRCPVHLSIGQEAVAVGICADLKKTDLVYSTHRCHAHYLAKGGSLKRMIAEIYGKETGCTGGRGGSMHLIDLDAGFGGATPIVGNSIPIAVGTAFANKLKNNHNITVVFLGDGTVEEGVFHESLNFAALKKLSILFVCENNLFSVYTHLSERQTKHPIYKLAQGHGVEASQHDGNNLSEIYKVSSNAIKKLRSGNGPVFLEFLTYRHREHCGPNFDDNLGYRDERLVRAWKKKDPIDNFEKHILATKAVSQKVLDVIKKATEDEIREAFDFAKSSNFPKHEELYERIYSS